MAGVVSSPRGGFRIAAGAALLVVSGVLVLRASGAWPGDAVVWPSLLAALGGLLIWHQPRSHARRRRAWAAHPPAEQAAPARATPALLRSLPRPELSGMGLGIALVLGAGLAFLWANGALRPAGEVVLAALVALAAVALVFAPSWRRLARSLATERAERVRAQEREEVAAHLHDSVLQTLALIQRNAQDPQQVAALARRQERELRAWLAGEEDEPVPSSLAAALDAAAVELEESLGATVEVVTVGDGPLDDSGVAVVAAAREAMLNAAKFAAGGPVSVYAEVGDERIQVFVRDRGDGFDPEAVPPERRGLRESIRGRMRRAGGTAVVRSEHGGGTEVELSIAREPST
jgi:signal transduction histidine kinase